MQTVADHAVIQSTIERLARLLAAHNFSVSVSAVYFPVRALHMTEGGAYSTQLLADHICRNVYSEVVDLQSQNAAGKVLPGAHRVVVPALDLPALRPGAAVVHHQGIPLLGAEHEPKDAAGYADLLDFAL